MKKLKKPTTYEEQVAKLQGRRIIVDDTQDCIDFLSKVSYYRLSGYYLPYIDPQTDKCFRDTQFERIRGSYEFDAAIRNWMTSIIEIIEVFLRSQISYAHSHHYGAEGYLDSSSFGATHDHKAFLRQVEQCKSNNAKAPDIMHHKRKYKGHIPIWVIIHYFSAGTLSYFFRDLTNSFKTKLAKDMYGVNYKVLESWLKCFTELRNRCAHFSRLYYWKFPSLPKMPAGETYLPSPNRRLFTQIFMLKLMYPNHEQWNTKELVSLAHIMDVYGKYISLKHIGFPTDWYGILRWNAILE